MIAFSGLDGAGKSTQIELLENYFKHRDKSVVVFWSRGGYTPGMLRLKKLTKVSKNNVEVQKTEVEEKKREEAFQRPMVRKVWLLLSIFDLIYYYAIYIRFKEWFGTRVICDRHIKDTEIDFQLNFPQEKVSNWFFWKLLKLLAKKPQKHFIATIPVKESLRRSKLKNEPFPDAPEVLEERLKVYNDFISKASYTVHIDGLNTVEEIHQMVLKELNLKST